MKQKNIVVVDFLGGLEGFIRKSENIIIHLQTGHVISAVTFFSNSKKSDYSNCEDLKIEIGNKVIVVSYHQVIEFYIDSHAQFVERKSKSKEFKEMFQHLEYKFSQNGFNEG